MGIFGRQGLFGGTLTLGVCRGLAQGLGFVQFIYFLHVYGSSIRVDALFIAQTIPMLLTNFFGQPITVLFVPVFLHLLRREGDEEAWRFASALITLTAVLLGLLTAATVLLAPWIVALLAPGFTPDEQLLAAGLLQWMSVLIVINGLAGSARSLFFAHQAYAVPAVATIFPSLGIIAGIYFLSGQLGIYAYVIGGIAGSVVQLLLLWLLLNAGEHRLRFRLSRWHSNLKEFFVLLGPRFLILGAGSINGAIDRAFASTLGPASISAMGYAITITDTPTAWLRTTFGGTIVPVLSEDAAREDFESYKKRLQRFLGIAAFLMMPCSVLLVVLGTPLVQTLFQRGNFDAQDAQLMGLAASYYALGLVPAGMGAVLAGGFFSLKDTMTPFKVSCGLIFLNLGLNYLLINLMGLAGLALATSLVTLTRLMLFLGLFRRRLGAFKVQRTLEILGKMILAGAAMGAVLLVVGRALDVFSAPAGSFLDQAVPLSLTCLLGGVTYLAMSWLLGVPVVYRLSDRVLRSLGGGIARS